MSASHPRLTVADFAAPQVLSYSAHDMAPLARGLGYAEGAAQVPVPLGWGGKSAASGWPRSGRCSFSCMA